MKKESFQFPKVEKTVTVSGEKGTPSATALTYISWELEQLLIGTYVDVYFKVDDEDAYSYGADTNYVLAERAFDYILLKEMTSIKLDLKKYLNKAGMSTALDLAYESGFMCELKRSVVNLAKVRDRIERVVKDIKQEKYSPIGFVKDLTKVLESADISGLMEKVSGLKEFVSNSPLSSLMDEGAQG